MVKLSRSTHPVDEPALGVELPKTVEAVPALRIPAGLYPSNNLWHQAAALAIWPFFEQILTFTVGFVDASVAGYMLSLPALDAVGGAIYVVWLMQLLFGAAGTGATVLVSRAVGAGQWRRGRLVLGQALLLALVVGSLSGLVFYWAAPAIAGLTGLSGESHALCATYLRLLALAAPFSAILGIGNACLRGSGDTRTPFVIMGVVNLINIAACILLVAPWSPIGNHGITGLGLGTVCAWTSGAVLLLGITALRRKRMHLEARFLRPRAPVLWRVARIAWPNLMEMTGFWVGQYLVVIIIGHLAQPNTLAAHMIAGRIEAVSFLPGFALGMAASTMVGQYLGIHDPDRARRAAWCCWTYGAVMMTAVGVVFICFPEPLIRLVTDKPELLALAPGCLRITGFTQIALATAIVFSNALRGAGATRSAMVITYGCIFLVRLPLVLRPALFDPASPGLSDPVMRRQAQI